MKSSFLESVFVQVSAGTSYRIFSDFGDIMVKVWKFYVADEIATWYKDFSSSITSSTNFKMI